MILGASPLGAAPLGAASGGGGVAEATSTMACSMDAAYALISALRETADATTTTAGSLTMSPNLTDSGALSEGVVVVLRAIAADTAVVDSPIVAALTKLTPITETLVLSGVVSTRLDALVTIVEALVVEDIARLSLPVSASDTAEFAIIVQNRVHMIAGAVSAAVGSSSATPTLQLVAVVEDDAVASLTLATQAQLFASLSDGLNASLVLRFGTDEYAAYVLSVNRRQRDGLPVAGVVEYQNFPFNSFAKHNGRYYGASEHGIFELTGDTDNGAEIAAWVRAAINNFGTGRMKRMPSVYLGYTSTGTMVLKVVTVADGAKVEDWYTLRNKPADTMRDARIKAGRGLTSAYWAWELHNVDGADFALDVVELMPLVLERRIKHGN